MVKKITLKTFSTNQSQNVLSLIGSGKSDSSLIIPIILGVLYAATKAR